jgi:hypothetical protein
MRRTDERYGALTSGTEYRLQQSHLADAGLLGEKVRQGAQGPAATGKFCGQFGIARVYAACCAARKLSASPERRV